jgi:hypothetical protein
MRPRLRHDPTLSVCAVPSLSGGGTRNRTSSSPFWRRLPSHLALPPVSSSALLHIQNGPTWFSLQIGPPVKSCRSDSNCMNSDLALSPCGCSDSARTGDYLWPAAWRRIAIAHNGGTRAGPRLLQTRSRRITRVLLSATKCSWLFQSSPAPKNQCNVMLSCKAMFGLRNCRQTKQYYTGIRCGCQGGLSHSRASASSIINNYQPSDCPAMNDRAGRRQGRQPPSRADS